MITDNVEQRSLEWHRMRCGCITGSKVADIMKSGRKKDEVFSDTAKSYLFQVAGERMFNPTFLNDDGIFQDYLDLTSVSTKAMQFGSDQEDAAKTFQKERWRSCRLASTTQYLTSQLLLMVQYMVVMAEILRLSRSNAQTSTHI